MRVIGLISGTSVDGIDAAFIEISGTENDLKVDLLAGETYAYSARLREQILAVCAGETLSMESLAILDDAIAREFAQAAIKIQRGLPPAELIGSHGQTVYHRPPSGMTLGYSLQLGRGAVIARETGIPTASNFRANDIDAGGEGAPLVPRVDAYLLSHPSQSSCVQNIGGISNLTYLPAKTAPDWEVKIRGWDTGPGNALIDLAVEQFSQGSQTYDKGGAWAATGQSCQELVDRWLQHPFFQQAPPKSTGRELFSPSYLQQCLQDAQSLNLSQADILATLTEFTAASIVASYRQFLLEMPDRVLLCGGGSRNAYLRTRLTALLAPIPVLTTDEFGVSADFKEAIAFAVLAYWRQQGLPGNLPSVTHAQWVTPLGEIHASSKVKVRA